MKFTEYLFAIVAVIIAVVLIAFFYVIFIAIFVGVLIFVFGIWACGFPITITTKDKQKHIYRWFSKIN